MKYSIETKRTLITDNENEFIIGNDIAFTISNLVTGQRNHYLGEITEITDISIKIKRIVINDKINLDGEMIIELNLIDPDSCNRVSCD